MKNILITGVPGIGKTTIIKRLIERLNGIDVEVDGFYTEEIRNEKNQRMGFHINLFRHNVIRTLADKSDLLPNENIRKLGAYTVYIRDFEDIALPPILEYESGILIIDEIGKMELFSRKFEQAVSNILKNKNANIVATVPVKGPAFVKRLKKDTGCQLLLVTEENREVLPDQIFEILIKPKYKISSSEMA